MAETHKAKLVFEKGKPEIDVIDDEPLYSATLYKYISDKIWEQKPRKDKWTVWGIDSVVPPEDAYAMMNDVVGMIKKQLVLTNKRINLGKKYDKGPDIVIPRRMLNTPVSAFVETLNWDDRNTGRVVFGDDEKHKYARFTDGHRDYSRELNASFRFDKDGHRAVVTYAMQRAQHFQGKPTDLYVSLYHTAFQDQGYEGDVQHVTELTEQQEINVLRVMAKMGGIALNLGT